MAKKKGRASGEGTVLRRKDGLWQGAITTGFNHAGKQQRKTVYGKTQAEVRGKLDEIKQQLARGTFSDTKHTVESYVQEWLGDKLLEVKPQTVEDYRYQLEKYVLPRIGKVALTKLSPRHVQTLCTELATAISPLRANKCRRVLSGALAQAVRLELISRNPCDAVKPKRVEARDKVIWNAEQATLFLTAAREHRLYALFYLAMSTGLRRGELLGLRWQDVNGASLMVKQALIEQRGRVMFSTPKTAKGYRRVNLTADVTAILEAHRESQDAERLHLGETWTESGLVFTTRLGGTIHPCNLERTWYLLQESARNMKRKEIVELFSATLPAAALEQALLTLQEKTILPKARLHDLRHLYASIAIRDGMNPKELAQQLGHAKASFTLDVYTHLFDEQGVNSAVSIATLIQAKPSGFN